MPRAALVFMLVAGALLAAAGGWVYLMSNVGCAALSADSRLSSDGPTPHPGGVYALDEAQVRADAPDVAQLLDAAVRDGSATLDSQKRAPPAYEYLSARIPGGAQFAKVGWENATLELRYVVC